METDVESHGVCHAKVYMKRLEFGVEKVVYLGLLLGTFSLVKVESYGKSITNHSLLTAKRTRIF